MHSMALFLCLIESIPKSARHLQIFFGNSPYLPEGAEDYQRGTYYIHVCWKLDIIICMHLVSFEA